MRIERRLAVLVALAVAGLPGCTADEGIGGDEPAIPSAATSTTPPGPPAEPTTTPVTEPLTEPVTEPLTEPVPVARDAGYADAVGTFGEAQVQQAVADHARIAGIALADCHRWRTGELDSALPALLAPALLDRIEEELRRPPGYPPSLLSDLPADDGNGHDLAAAVGAGCDDSAPLHYDVGLAPNAVHVDRDGAEPRLVQVAGYAVEVAFGDTVVGAGQDWVLTSTPTATGWQLTDAEAGAPVTWFPVASG